VGALGALRVGAGGSCAAVAATVALACGIAPAAGAVNARACFGAAARVHQACGRLRLGVSPTPSVAEITPSAPCTPEGQADGIFNPLPGLEGPAPPAGSSDGLFGLCVFGAAPPVARHGVALVGDSHAGMWRAGLTVVARALDWEGASVTRASCPFSGATPIIPAAFVASCLRWRQAVVAWFAANPQVGTMLVAAHFAARVVPAPGETAFEAAVGGYLAAWGALPATVEHIVVLRDPPDAGRATGPCVQTAIDGGRDAARVCALNRHRALHRDPAVVAAGRFGPRASAIDMSRFFCDQRICSPVIGGVLVYADSNHITRAYSETLGPYLLHEIGQLLAGWQG
jgi:hypothetical protein